jgi:hypothetical protein
MRFFLFLFIVSILSAGLKAFGVEIGAGLRLLLFFLSAGLSCMIYRWWKGK